MERFLSDGGKSAEHLIPELLQAVRQYLRMEVAFLSQFVTGERVFRYVDTDAANSPVRAGGSDPLETSYCQKVVKGHLPELMQDAFEVSAALAMSVTRELPVRAHISVPIRLSDGQVYGTFCAFSSQPDQTLGARDLAFFRVFADLAAKSIDRSLAAERERAAIAGRIEAAMHDDSIRMVYQPIVDLTTGNIVGYEALARFRGEPIRSPDQWFAAAKSVGLGVDLELFAARRALQGLRQLPSAVPIGINLSPAALVDNRLRNLLENVDPRCVVLEITEHDVVSEYGVLVAGLSPLRATGVRLAVDDAGAGYASFRHILRLRPDRIKLDIGIVNGIERDAGQQALAVALAAFARETNAEVCAEGIETPEELRTLQRLKIQIGQGYLFGRPGPLRHGDGLCSMSLEMQPG